MNSPHAAGSSQRMATYHKVQLHAWQQLLSTCRQTLINQRMHFIRQEQIRQVVLKREPAASPNPNQPFAFVCQGGRQQHPLTRAAPWHSPFSSSHAAGSRVAARLGGLHALPGLQDDLDTSMKDSPVTHHTHRIVRG
jgi:CTP:molybdopterin cytidylyltransferase MocA